MKGLVWDCPAREPVELLVSQQRVQYERLSKVLERMIQLPASLLKERFR